MKFTANSFCKIFPSTYSYGIYIMSRKLLKSCGLVLLTVALAGCGATRVSTSQPPIPAFLIDENVTITGVNYVLRVDGGSDTANNNFIPIQTGQIISTPVKGCDEGVGSAVFSLGFSLVACGIRVAATNVRGIKEWDDYRKVLRLGSENEVPHYRIQIQAEGRQLHGLLAFNPIPEEAGAAAPRSYQVTLYSGGRSLPQFGNVKTTYGLYVPAKYEDVKFASWMLWVSDIPLM